MRITIITGFFLPVPALSGGATERSWHGLAKIFAAAGHSVTFVSRKWPGLADLETVDGVRHLRLGGFDHTRHLAMNLALDFLWGIRAGRSLPPGDVVICNTVTLPVWLRVLRPSAGRVAVMLGRAPKGQVAFYASVDRLYLPSTPIAAQLSPAARQRSRVIGYPIDWTRLSTMPRPPRARLTIGYVGRLHPEKGLALLVGAASRLAERTGLPDWRLKVVGPSSTSEGGGGGPWTEALRAEGAKAGDRIEWHGPEYDPGRLAALYAEMDIFCYPSLAETGETFGVGVAEAMASGSAVVVSALGCFRDLVTDGETGLVFDHRASDAEDLLANCMDRLLRNTLVRKTLSENGRTHARRFDYGEVSRVVLDDLALLTGTPERNPQ